MRLRRTLSATAGLVMVTLAVLHLEPLGRTGAPGSGTSAAADLNGRLVVPVHGTGRLRVVPVPGPASAAIGRTVRYTVEVEDGLGVDARTVAATVRTVLLDRRGWQAQDRVRFVNVTPAQSAAGAGVDIRVTLASPALTDRLCAPLQTRSEVSCWNGTRAVLNLRRWVLGDDSFGRDVTRYRIYQVNHEVGHGLGHGHQTCPHRGTPALVMQQQTITLGGCEAWPWPTRP
ncbi:MAG TPA: DUF3152 domain-containing protein [Oryzihumus sp.]|nr:DUF3152 domain-containing protein [Oryzihumus sp.]